MKTAISVPDATFERVEVAAKRLGVSRSQFFARAAERWLDELGQDGITKEIDAALATGGLPDSAFTDRAAALIDPDESW